jgi:hypothetical protein
MYYDFSEQQINFIEIFRLHDMANCFNVFMPYIFGCKVEALDLLNERSKICWRIVKVWKLWKQKKWWTDRLLVWLQSLNEQIPTFKNIVNWISPYWDRVLIIHLTLPPSSWWKWLRVAVTTCFSFSPAHSSTFKTRSYIHAPHNHQAFHNWRS